ncbi:TonB family protein [Stigmatella sp. ncwal1]|uniref:TonB family protein n=1 Tax=Stigmatella ashevillensis TaxID=2995309 RepID=A0ABT5DC06_9BACT|nr:energy transducer TonB [Stigmatella ashevillena]MDC0710615.1 TonB family protein [Stigmatella ashevillena]
MSQAALDNPLPPRRSSGWAMAFVLVSVALHGLGLVLLSRLKERPVPTFNKPVELVMVDVEKPPPPPPEPPKEEPPPPPPPPKVKAPPKPPPVKVAELEKPPPPPPEQAPPPPNEPPPEQPAKPVPLVVGISMSSTTSAGGFAAPVGNTAYGRVDGKATAPQEVKTYSAPKYTPIYQVDSEPRVLSEVKIPYPDEARRAGIEGTVTLSITVDLEGKVVTVKVISGPGYGLNEAARDAIRRFRFKPAIKGGEAVSTEMKYAYTFLLD